MKLEITLADCNKLLDLLGHEEGFAEEETAGPVVDLVRLLYVHFRALVDSKLQSSPLELTRKQLFTLHKHFIPQSFGEGGREFRVKLAQAFTDLTMEEEGLNLLVEAERQGGTLSPFDKLNLDMYYISEEKDS